MDILIIANIFLVLQAIGNGTGIESSKESWMQIIAPYIEEKTSEVGEIFAILLVC